jgi:CBS domain-containing protein
MSKSVREIMRREFVTVSGRERLDEALRIMRMGRLRHLLVERDGELIGLLSYRDLQDRVLSHLEDAAAEPRPGPLEGLQVSDAMVDSPYFLSPEASLSEAALRLTRLHVGCLPVVERAGGTTRLVGLVTESDLLRAAYACH